MVHVRLAAMHYLRRAILCLLATVAVTPAGADMRCAPHLVTRGLTRIEVLERCGPPIFEEHRWEELAPGVWVEVHEWTYEQGGNKFRRLLRFENGRLEWIEVRDKPRIPMADPGRAPFLY